MNYLCILNLKTFVFLDNGLLVLKVKNPHSHFLITTFKMSTQKQIHLSYLQVLGFLLLCSVGADLAATGGSGAQLRGDEGEHTLHHPPSAQKEGPVASCRYCS